MMTPKFATSQFPNISEEIIKNGNAIRFTVSGVSMGPFLKSDDVVEVEPVEVSDISPGSIIFYKHDNGRAIVHRVIRKRVNAEGVYLVTKGDAVRVFDLPISEKQVLGRVTSVERSGRTVDWTKFRMKAVGWALAYGHPFSYRILGKMRKARRYLRDIFKTSYQGRKNAS